jgi:hypothetical protein
MLSHLVCNIDSLRSNQSSREFEMNRSMKLPMFIVGVCMFQLVRSYAIRRPQCLSSARWSSSGHVDDGTSISNEQMYDKFHKQQAALPRLSYAERVKTLINQSNSYGVLSTNSKQYEGYPTGSVVGFHTRESGEPFFSLSRMSAHTKDLSRDGRASLTVMSNPFRGAADSRVVLVGDITEVSESSTVATLKEKYLERHKDAYWVEFG